MTRFIRIHCICVGQWVNEVLPAKERQQCGDVLAMVWCHLTPNPPC
jgi:hypothetical protein